MRAIGVFTAAVLLIGHAAEPVWTQATQRRGTNPPAVFADPDRRAKLSAAFPEIDKMVGEFMTRTRVPGAAWGIVIDGELAHIGVAGFANCRASLRSRATACSASRR